MTATLFRVSNSLDHLRAEVRGSVDDWSSNPDLLVLRKLIEEESEHDGTYHDLHTTPARDLGSGYFRAPLPGPFVVDRVGAPGQWAAQARSHSLGQLRLPGQVHQRTEREHHVQMSPIRERVEEGIRAQDSTSHTILTSFCLLWQATKRAN